MKLNAYPGLARDLTTYWGSWPVSMPVELGMIATVRNRVFQRVKNLSNIPQLPPFTVKPDQKISNENYYQGVDHAVTIDAGGAATGPLGHANVTLRFSTAASALIALH